MTAKQKRALKVLVEYVANSERGNFLDRATELGDRPDMRHPYAAANELAPLVGFEKEDLRELVAAE